MNMSLEDAVKWYSDNCDCEITKKYIEHIASIGLIEIKNNEISIEDLNGILLSYKDGNAVYNVITSKKCIKENRKPLIRKYINDERNASWEKAIAKTSNIEKDAKKTEGTKKLKLVATEDGKMKLMLVYDK